MRLGEGATKQKEKSRAVEISGPKFRDDTGECGNVTQVSAYISGKYLRKNSMKNFQSHQSYLTS